MKRSFSVVVLLFAGACASLSQPVPPPPAWNAIDGALVDDAAVGSSEEVAEEFSGLTVSIDLEKALKVRLPDVSDDLEPVSFTTPDGKHGWALRIPGNRPIATPAWADGKIFVGGGYGSHEFYAFDARTGELEWKMQTQDDGPTAAVVEEGLVAFNTESCTVVVAEAATGKLVWQEWLGDPLMSQPAIAAGRVFMAFPGGGKGHAVGYFLLCADLKTGKHLWEKKITADAISAPVIDEKRVYVTCFDGTSFCFEAEDGKELWTKKTQGTSAPVVANGNLVQTVKEAPVRGAVPSEGVKRIAADDGLELDKKALASGQAPYLRPNAGGGGDINGNVAQTLDAGVGFGAGGVFAEAAANTHLGVNTVAGGWAYQGARAAVSGDRIFNARASTLNCLKADGTIAWRGAISKGKKTLRLHAFSPPALGKKRLYLAGPFGHLASIAQEDGSVGFLYEVGRSFTFQPALAKGRLFVGTSDGLLISIDTGDADADGWTAWGGNAQHNKKN